MRRLIPVLRLLGRSLLFVLVLTGVGAGVGLVTLLHHPAVPPWLSGIAEEATGGQLTVTVAEGRLAGPLHLEGVQWQGDGLTIAARSVDLEWRPLDLLAGRLHIQRLHVRGARVTRSDPPPEPPPSTDDPGVTLPELPALPLTLDLAGVRLDLDQAPGLAGPLRVRLAARAGGTRLRSLAATVRHRGARLELAASGDWSEYRLKADLQARSPTPLGPAEGQLTLSGDIAEAHLEGEASGPARLRVAGRVRSLLDGPDLDLTLRADRPGPALQERVGRPWLGHLRARITGTARTPEVELRGGVDLGEEGLWSLAAAANRSADGWLRLPELALARRDGAGGALSGRGAWHTGEARGALTLTSDGLALPGQAGRLDQLRLSAGGALSPARALAVEVRKMTGQLRGHELAASGRGTWTDGGWHVEGLEAALGANRVTARARGPRPLRADLRLRVPRLDAFHPELGGRLLGNIEWADGRGQGRITGHDLAWGEAMAIPYLQASGAGTGDQLEAALAIPDATAGGRDIGGAALSLAGSPRRLDWNLAAGLPRLALNGTLEPLERRLSAGNGVFRLGDEFWHLAGRLRAERGEAGWGVESGCWVSETGGRLCAGAQGDPEGGTAALDLAGLELPPLARLVPGGTRLQSGRLASRARLRWTDAIEQLDFHARARDLALSHPRLGDEVAARLERLELSANQGPGGGLRIRTAVHAGESGPTRPGNRLTGHLQLPEWQWREPDPGSQPLTGELRADGLDLTWLGPLLPGFVRSEGHLEARITLEGTLASPLPRGDLHWREGRLRIADAGLDLRPVTATLTADGMAPLRIQARAESGDGHLAVTGEVQPRPPVTADLRLSGEAARVIDLPEASITAQPDIRFTVTPEAASVQGEVRVPEARLVLPEGGGGAVSPSPDVVYREGGREAAGLPLDADIRLLLGPRVYLRGHGFRGRLEGDLRLRQSPGSPTLGRGELVIRDGHYRAWGQELIIDPGRLLFADTPVDNPGLNLRAVRPGLPVTAGIQVGGRLREPTLELFSEPPMEDSEILSWVVLGRPLQSASGEEGASLAAAATALQLAGGGRLANELGDRFGIDEVGIASGTTADSAALVLGTWLSPRLYVRYAIGLTEDINTLRTRYLLDEQWTLEAETGAASGIDLLWSIDR